MKIFAIKKELPLWATPSQRKMLYLLKPLMPERSLTAVKLTAAPGSLGAA